MSDTKKWDAIRKAVAKAGASHVRVGVLQSKGGSATAESGISMVELAAIHEFGAPGAGIPERSFIRSTLRVRKAAELARVQTKLATAIIEKNMPVKKALGILGSWAATECKNTITQTAIPPPLKAATIARKGSDRALVDTGRLLGAISYEVVEGGEEE